ncbi:Xaa-Pro peptidase family protein [Salinicoccus sp. RF5]|uniref:M24 family metallopeptidase n=1 Tax=Salinicoccus sp. RF5 TaxID=2748874 RepID=UPI001E3FD172|nr:Xaa-Pro peptidase family protein [Salinicoccus sp. RF5]MCC4723329.1 Xaa-Pro peptidase family protein [Salinicoccus sp. RF5]
MNTQYRISKLREGMKRKAVDTVIIYSLENRRYFSNFTGSSGALIITQDKVQLLTDFRYFEQANTQVDSEVEVLKHEGGLLDESVAQKTASTKGAIGVEGNLSLNTYRLLEESNKGAEYPIIDEMIMDIRQIKDGDEIENIREGIRLCDLAFEHILSFIKPGMSEKDIGLELEYFMKKNGAEGIKANHVIASGERSALPHGSASKRIISEGEFVKMDYGAVVNGYFSDFTRTVVLGEPSEKQREIYDIVHTAIEETLKHIGPGKICSELDDIGRSIIREAGYGDNFGHSLGHSLGLNIHEKPAMRNTDHTKLQPGMVITVEPGIYIPGWGGVRIEDLLVITEDGYENFTKSTKDLQILDN